MEQWQADEPTEAAETRNDDAETTETIIVADPLEHLEPESPESIWQELTREILEFHFKPDLMAVQIILAFEASYQLHNEDHLWLHLIGPSSSGKTSLGIALLDGLFPDHHQLGEISPNTFLSGLARGKQKGKMNSFLHQIGDKGLVYAPDFTNFLSNDPQTVGKVAGQLREIYDGSMTKRAGSMDTVNEWKGQVGMITAFTPSKESAWHYHNREGERFLSLRWPGTRVETAEDEAELGRIMNLGGKKARQGRLRELVRKLLLWKPGEPGEMGGPDERIKGSDDGSRAVRENQGAANSNRLANSVHARGGISAAGNHDPGRGDVPELSPVYDRLSKPDSTGVSRWAYRLARVIGKLRTLPVRADGKNISHIAGEEGSGRAFKQLIKCAVGWRSLMRGNEVTVEDWRLSERLAVDTIPEVRRWMLEGMPWSGDGLTSKELLLEITPFHSLEAVEWHLADLKALGVVGTNQAGEVWLMDEFVELVESAAPGWVRGLRESREEKVAQAEERLAKDAFEVRR